MGMFMDAIKSLADMKELSKLTDTIEEQIKKLDSEGKLPEELKKAFETLKNTKSSGGSVENSLKPLEQFASVMEKYENLFPDSIKSVVGKLDKVTDDLEGIATRVDKMSKK